MISEIIHILHFKPVIVFLSMSSYQCNSEAVFCAPGKGWREYDKEDSQH